ncbi:MAG: hypothetical protein KKB50_06985 [Planctomycetes bacterium]|nr:hypothetical protein [Planctomycetota bacterium]
MKTLNDPLGWDDQDDQDDEDWTPAKGMLRAAAFGVPTAVLLAGLTMLGAYYVPVLFLNMLLRTALAFAIAWILFGVVQRSAGMVGYSCTALAIVLTLLVLCSHNVVFALHGIGTVSTTTANWEWLHPFALLAVNIVPLIGVIACALMRHSGAGGDNVLAEILNMGIFVSRR